MNNLSTYIQEVYEQQNDNEIHSIESSVVDEALYVVKHIIEIDSLSLLYLLSSLNLLNAAIKQKEHRGKLSYAKIKPRVTEVVENVLTQTQLFPETFTYYSKQERCMYFQLYGVVFSFHNILETELIKNSASENPPIVWLGVRLQRIAQKLFLYVKNGVEDRVVFANRRMEVEEKAVNTSAKKRNGYKVGTTDVETVVKKGETVVVTTELLASLKEGQYIGINYLSMRYYGTIDAISNQYIVLLSNGKRIKVSIGLLKTVEMFLG